MKSEPWKGQERARVSVSAQPGEREACLSLSHPFLPARRHSALTLQTASSPGAEGRHGGQSPHGHHGTRQRDAPAPSPKTGKSLGEAPGLGHRLSAGPISCGHRVDSQKPAAAPIEEGVGEKRHKQFAEEVGSCLERSRGTRMTRLEIPQTALMWSCYHLGPGP